MDRSRDSVEEPVRSYSQLQAVAMGWDAKCRASSEPPLELIVRVSDTAINISAGDVVSFFDELGYRYNDDGRAAPPPTDAIVEDNWVFVRLDNASRVSRLFVEAKP